MIYAQILQITHIMGDLICVTGINYRMAKTSERLNASHNYMKKVKSSISMVIVWSSFLTHPSYLIIFTDYTLPVGGGSFDFKNSFTVRRCWPFK